MTDQRLASFINKLDSDPSYRPDAHSCVELLRLMRKARVHRSDIVARVGQIALNASGVSADERYTIAEQVFVDALYVCDDSVADLCLQMLVGAFPGSSRVKRLLGMKLESEQKYNEALKIYDELLTENPLNLLVMKRKVCVYRDSGNDEKAIETLNEILKIFASDTSSWQELAEMYLLLKDFKAAAFCYEELVLLDPQNPFNHSRLGDIYYTIGGAEGALRARKHYTFSLSLLSPHLNPRALKGLKASSAMLEMVYNQSTSEEAGADSNEAKEARAVNKELLAWANEQK